MLSVLLLTYKGKPTKEILQQSIDLEQQVWTDYVYRMVAEKGNIVHYPLERTRTWLCWLAQQMQRHQQPIFYLEHLQPDWLPTKRSYRLYQNIVVLLVVLVSGILGGVGGVLFSREYFLDGNLQGNVHLLKWEGFDELSSGLLTGLPIALFGGLFEGLLLARGKFHVQGLKKTGEAIQFAFLTWQRHLFSVSLTGGLLLALVILTLLSRATSMPSFWSAVRCILLGIPFGLIVGTFYGLQKEWIAAKREEKDSLTTLNQGLWHAATSGGACLLSVVAVCTVTYGLYRWSLSPPISSQDLASDSLSDRRPHGSLAEVPACNTLSFAGCSRKKVLCP
jgi:hypothetical protein